MNARLGLNGGSSMARGIRKSITIPGQLAPTVKQRCGEFGHTILLRMQWSLVCYDQIATRSYARAFAATQIPRLLQ